MPLHLVKLCVGADSVEDLQAFVDRRARQQRRTSHGPHSFHDTRMWPKREVEVLDGGSLYWVIRGSILVRQRLVALERRKGADGVGRCRLILEPRLVRTEPRGKRPFQGWRYLPAEDAPPDLAEDAARLSPGLVAALKDALVW